MTFQDDLMRTEATRAELARAQAGTAGWAGQERRNFDAHRIKPLADAGAQLSTALKRALEQSTAAERLLAD